MNITRRPEDAFDEEKRFRFTVCLTVDSKTKKRLLVPTTIALLHMSFPSVLRRLRSDDAEKGRKMFQWKFKLRFQRLCNMWMIFSWDGLCLWISGHDILIHDGKSNIELGSNDMARSVTNHFEHMESQKYTLVLLIHCSTEPSFLLFKIIWYYLWHHRKEKGEIWNP